LIQPVRDGKVRTTDEPSTVYDQYANTGLGTVAGKLEFGAYRIARILVISTDDTVPLQILALTSSDMLIYSNKQGQQVEVGTIKDGIFVAHTSKECAGEIVTLGSKALGKGATLIKRLSGAKK
jgi:hypothetical protein